MRINKHCYVSLYNILILIMIIAFFSFFAGCRQNRSAAGQSRNGKINVTAAVFPAYDFVRKIAEDRVNLTMLLPPGAESHSFEPSPKDIITIQNSGVFIFIGGNNDMWVERILQSMNTENMKILAMMDMVDVLEEEFAEGMEYDHDHDDPDHYCDVEYDEHVWTSPGNAVIIVRMITDLLCETDAENEALFRQNASLFIEELLQLDAAFSEVAANAKRKTVIFGDRFPFRYLVDAYGLSYFAAFSGCSTETEPSAAAVAFLINKVRDEKIPVVFHIELSNERMADIISSETGVKKLLLHSVHNVTKRDFDLGIGYLELMRLNIKNLKEALY